MNPRRRSMIIAGAGVLATACGCCVFGLPRNQADRVVSPAIPTEPTRPLPTPTMTAREAQKRHFESQFNAEGANLPLVSHVTSIGFGQDFEVITSNWSIESDDTIQVQMRFRHTNKRGRNEVLCLAEVNGQGQVVEFRVLSSRPVR